ncbi:MAG: hypothetical protein AB4426_23345 [Xenococcaceae cyanobacterium]
MRVPLLLLIFPLFLSQLASAQISSLPVSCDSPPLDSELLKENGQIAESVITNQTISETGITIPSLWWTKEQFDPFGGKLIDNWLAYQHERRIDIVVNRQLWSLLNYMERYRFVNKFGTVAREHNYNLRVFNQQKKCLATYTCNFSTTPHQCEIDFEPSVQNSLQI